ncbi:MAG: (2Fe-2S) ferredoxin domain-containing protein [Fervidobacterium nodosum]
MESEKDLKNEKCVVSICFGSSCHLKGSYSIAERLKEFIEKNKLENSFELKGSLCLGMCVNGVNILIDDKLLSNINCENIEVVYEYLRNKFINEGDN